MRLVRHGAICVLYLVKQRLLHIPVLYLSRYIVRTKGEYYRLLHTVRDEDTWEAWVLYMLAAVEDTNNLFLHPYTKIDFLKDDLGVTRLTATRYLDALVADGTLDKRKIGRSNYYINRRLCAILTGAAMTEPGP